MFQGCASDDECLEIAPTYGCFPQHADMCLQTCGSPSDCGSGLPAWDADNYECLDGACIYQGCNDTDECEPDEVCVAHQ